MARTADITLTNADDLRFDLDDPGYNFDLGLDGIGSQDFGDLGISFGDGEEPSVEVGRDAEASRMSVDSNLMDREGSIAKSRMSEDPFAADPAFDFGGDVNGMGMDLDLGLNFGGGDIPTEDRAKSSRASKYLVLLIIRAFTQEQLHLLPNRPP